MKRIVCALITVILLLSLSSCTGSVESTIAFYYRTKQISYDSENGVIAAEHREAAELSNNLWAVLNLYLQGPQTAHLASPFPDGSAVVWMNQTEEKIILYMNDDFSKMTGVDLILACACLSKTLINLTGTDTVTIYGEETNLDGNSEISISKENLLLLDRYLAPVSED